MSTTTQLRAYITIDTTVMAKGSEELANLRAALKGVAEDAEGVVKVQTRLTEVGEQSVISTRSLLLNFRMFSFAVRTLRRELGITHPAFESFSRVMLVGAAAGTLFVSANTLITQGLPKLVGEAGKGLSIMGGLAAAFKAGNVAVIGLSVAVGGLIGYAVGSWIGETFTPIREITGAVKAYEDQIEDLTSALTALKVEQSDLSAESSMYAAAIAKVNYEIELQGYATEAQTETLKMLENASKRASMEQSGLRAATAMVTAEATRAAAEKETLEAEAKEYRKGVYERFNPFTWGTSGPQGGLGGERGEANRGNTQGGGNAPISVQVDFTGSTFGRGIDVEDAARRGILQGFGALSARELEMLRRGE